MVSFWYVVLPATPLVDALFLIALGAIYLSKSFDWIYASPIPKQALSPLGHAMLIRTGALAILILRGNANAEFRFLPNRSEWMTGLRYFAVALPVAGLAYWALGLFQLRAHPLNVLQALGVFLGVLWFVALSEEFLLSRTVAAMAGTLDRQCKRGTHHGVGDLRKCASGLPPDLSQLALGDCGRPFSACSSASRGGRRAAYRQAW